MGVFGTSKCWIIASGITGGQAYRQCWETPSPRLLPATDIAASCSFLHLPSPPGATPLSSSRCRNTSSA